MENFQRFVKLDDDRINVTKIISYGLAVDEDDDRYLYVNTTDDDSYSYYDEDVEFDLDEKISELDSLLLIRRLGHVDFQAQ